MYRCHNSTLYNIYTSELCSVCWLAIHCGLSGIWALPTLAEANLSRHPWPVGEVTRMPYRPQQLHNVVYNAIN